VTAPIAFFDVDHTLTRRSTGYRFAVEAAKRGVVRAHRLAGMPFYYMAYRLGRPSPALFEREHAILRGIKREFIMEVAQAAFESRIAADLFPQALELIASLKEAGTKIYLATSSFDFVVHPLAARLGAEGIVASHLEFVDGVSTGRFEGRPAFGPVKLERASAEAEAAGVGLAGCSFYSDSIHDLPLLLAVGKAVAVNPDPRLLCEARRRGWERLYFRVLRRSR
jgi:HAD superfamily hydrolase (TIGR01490 family)